MKKLLLLFPLFLLPFMGEAQVKMLKPYLSTTVYDLPGTTPYVENALAFECRSAVYKEFEPGKFKATVEITTTFRPAGDSLICNYSKIALDSPVVTDLVRLQCAFIDTPEVEKVTEYIGAQRGYAEPFLLPEVPDEEGEGIDIEEDGERDSLFEDAARIVVQTQQGSTSMIQRKLKLGYNRAGRIIDQLEAAGIVGPFSGSKSREVKVKDEFALEQILRDIYNKDNGI